MRPGITFWDVNVSFNHEPSYYSISRGDGRVITRECLVTKSSGRRSIAWPLDGLAEMSAEEILSDDLYRAYQGVFW